MVKNGQERGCQVIPQFHILIVCVVDIYKQSLQTALASSSSEPLPGPCPLAPIGVFRPQTPRTTAP